MNRSFRLLLLVAAVAIASVSAWVRYQAAQDSVVTADKVAQYARSVDIGTLSGSARSEAMRQLEEKINSLPLEERRKWRMGTEWRQWFNKMTEPEKGQFIEATMPTGFTQVLNVFEDMPEQRRKQIIDDAVKNLKETHQLVTDREPGQNHSMYGTNAPPILTAELENRVRTIGLRTFYTESSAEAKAELAPFLEELQRQMEAKNVSR
jgi:hypothetical protein